MTDYELHDFLEAEFKTTFPSGYRRYIKCTGEVVLIRKKYIVFEDSEEVGYLILKKDFKPIKKVKR